MIRLPSDWLQFLRGDFSTNASAKIGVDGADSFFQAHGGNVGIGTTTPSANLDVRGPVRVASIAIRDLDGDATGSFTILPVSNFVRIFAGGEFGFASIAEVSRAPMEWRFMCDVGIGTDRRSAPRAA